MKLWIKTFRMRGDGCGSGTTSVYLLIHLTSTVDIKDENQHLLVIPSIQFSLVTNETWRGDRVSTQGRRLESMNIDIMYGYYLASKLDGLPCTQVDVIYTTSRKLSIKSAHYTNTKNTNTWFQWTCCRSFSILSKEQKTIRGFQRFSLHHDV